MYEGLDNILKCLKLWNNEHVKFIIVGDGTYKNELVKYIETNNMQKNIIYLGKLDHRDVIQYYNIIDSSLSRNSSNSSS